MSRLLLLSRPENGWGRSPGAWLVVYVWFPSLKESGADCEGVVECAVAGLGWGTVGSGHWGWVFAHGRESVADSEGCVALWTCTSL